MKKLLTTLSVVLLTVLFAFAQPGKIDTAYYLGMGFNDQCFNGIVLPDSSLLIAGNFTTSNERNINRICKLKPDGSNDYSFNPGTGANNFVSVAIRQSDGKFVIGGDFTSFNGTGQNRVARLNSNGSVDNSYSIGTGFNGNVLDMYVQSDGKIIMTGVFTTYNSTSVGGIVRLNTDGTKDTSFHCGTGGNAEIDAIDRMPDGSYLIGGDFTSYNGTSVTRIARLNSDGSLNNTFNVGGSGPNVIVYEVLGQSNGKVLAAGNFTTYNGTTANRIVRLKTDGTIDTSFHYGTGFNAQVNGMCIQPNGKIVATGNFSSYNGTSITRIVRIDTTGAMDAGFNPGIGLTNNTYNVFLNPDGKIYATGTFTLDNRYSRLYLTRLLSDGSVDVTFFHECKLNEQPVAMGVQSSGKVILGGAFTQFSDNVINRIVRMLSDGKIDTTFHSGTGANNTIQAIVVLSNDKILIGGDFTSYNGTTINRIARLNPDGSLDTSFHIGTGANNTVWALDINSTGKIYAGGDFTSINGTTKNRVVRLNSDGSLDNGFNIGTGTNGIVYAIRVQSDNKVVAGGAFTSYNGTTSNRIVRIDTAGTLDAGYNVGSGTNGDVRSLILQTDGKALIGGAFTTYNGTTKNRIARLSTAGALDATFTASITSVSGSPTVKSLCMYNNGVVAGGDFNLINTVSKVNIGYVDSTGTIDNNGFNIGSSVYGAGSVVNTIKRDTFSQRVLVGGVFQRMQNLLSLNFSGLTGSYSVLAIDSVKAPTSFCAGSMSNVKYKNIKPFNKGNLFTVQLSDSSGSFTSPTSVGTKTAAGVAGWDSLTVILPTSALTSAHYKVRVTATNPLYTSAGSAYFNIYAIPAAPTAPTAQSLCSDTSAHTFTFSGVNAGSGGNQIEWAKNIAYTGSTTISSGGNIVVSVNSGTRDTIWLRSKASATGCVSSSVFTTASTNKKDTSVHAGTVTSNYDSVCWMTGATLTTAGYNGTLQWQLKDTSNTWVNISGATTNTLVVDSFLAATSYRVISTKDYCSHDTSNTKTVTLKMDPNCIYQINWYYLMVHVTDTNTIPIQTDSVVTTHNSTLNTILRNVHVTNFYKPFNNAQTAYLNNVWAIKCKGNVDSLLAKVVRGGFYDYVQRTPYYIAATCSNGLSQVTPNDYGTNWALDKINAKCAWSVTTGDANVIVGIVDGEFETTHEDLATKFVSVSGQNLEVPVAIHGSKVASCVAAHTANNLGLAAIGYNIEMAGYLVPSQENPFLGGIIDPFSGIWLAYQDGRKIINLSASAVGCPGGLSGCLDAGNQQITSMLVQELTANGSTLVLAAGNDPYNEYHQAYGNIPGVVIVSGSDPSDNYTTGFSRYANVDLCAPAIQVPIVYPYNVLKYSTADGTSFAAPLTAGTAGLLLSINPCLGPQDIEYLLKSTTAPLANAASYPGVIGTGRLDAYQACLAAQTYTSYINATQNIAVSTTWSHNVHLYGDVTVANDAILTINNGAVIDVAPGRKIKILAGGKLVINNGTLTSACSGMWGGIYVEGITTSSQQAVPGTGTGIAGHYAQGALFLTDATIKNAVTGIDLGSANAGLRGGFVLASNCHFINNKVDVLMPPYSNFSYANHNVLKPNVSYFNTCNFSTTAALNDGSNPIAHVIMYFVNGVKFKGCVFENTRTGLTYDYQLGNGIYALDAGFTVDYYCAPPTLIGCTTPTPSQFVNLRHGVYTGLSLSSHSCAIYRSKFDHCIRGIRCENVNFCNFSGNDIAVGSTALVTDYTSTGTIGAISEGIMLHLASGFTLEGNKIYAATDIHGAPLSYCIGIRADNTGIAHNKILNNTFNQLSVANGAMRQNRRVIYPLTGLEYLCNTHTNNLFDLVALPKDATDANGPATGIQQTQGSTFHPSGNLFSTSGSSYSERNFYNHAPNDITYPYYNTGSQNPAYHTPLPKVNPFITTTPSTCASQSNVGLTNFYHELSTASASALQSQFSSNDASMTSLQSDYASRIDSGSTSNLISYLSAHNTASDSNLVRTKLMNASPWLSETVLEKAATTENGLPNTKMFEVLYANPDGIQNDTLVALLRKRKVPMPDSLINKAIVHKDTVTARTTEEDSLMRVTSLRNAAGFEAIDRIIQSDDSLVYDSLRVWLYKLKLPFADAQVALSYIEASKLDSATNVMARLYGKYQLTYGDSAHFKSIDTLINGYITYYAPSTDTVSKPDLSLLDSTHLASINGFAVTRNQHLQGTGMTRNILNILYKGTYYTPPMLPVDSAGNQRMARVVEEPEKSTIGQKVKVYPNPANDNVSFELSNLDAEAVITVYDLYGRVVMSKHIPESGKMVVDTHEWQAGIYIWQAKQNCCPIEQGKLEIIR